MNKTLVPCSPSLCVVCIPIELALMCNRVIIAKLHKKFSPICLILRLYSVLTCHNSWIKTLLVGKSSFVGVTFKYLPTNPSNCYTLPIRAFQSMFYKFVTMNFFLIRTKFSQFWYRTKWLECKGKLFNHSWW